MTSNISSRLKELRQSNGYSQEELAGKLFVTRQAISKWERGEALPDTENLIALATLYGISLDELVGYSASAKEVETDFESDSTSGSDTPSKPEKERNSMMRALYALPYPVLCTALFLLFGFLWNLWDVAWILFVTVPLYYSVLECIKLKRLSPLNYPVLVTCIYLFIGMRFSLWHPGWIIFFTIPLFYSVAHALDRKR